MTEARISAPRDCGAPGTPPGPLSLYGVARAPTRGEQLALCRFKKQGARCARKPNKGRDDETSPKPRVGWAGSA